MKRYLNHDHYELRDDEREALWHAIRRETHGPGPVHDAPRGAFRPALAVTAVLATLTLMVTWRIGSEQVQDRVPRRPALEIVELGEVRPAPPAPPVRESGPRRPDQPAADTAPAPAGPPAAVTMAKEPGTESVAAQALPGPVLTGRVVDKETGEPLAYATVLVRGTGFTAVTDSLGRFRFADLPAGGPVQLSVRMLSYAPVDLALTLPESGRQVQEFELEPVVVATLEAYDVEGAEYMVEVKSAVTEHRGGSRTFDRYAIDPVEDALSKQAGKVMGAAPPAGRRPDVARMSGGRVPAGSLARRLPPPSGSVTGGTTPPNGEQVELMYFENAGVNPFVATEDDALSTFAVDVDNASWTLARSYLERGMLPPKDAIRVEEFVNAFDAGWPHHTDRAFRIHTDGGTSRFGRGYHLLRIGVVGRDVDAGRRKPANLVFVIDVSGSMARESRLELVKKALHILLDELREGDRVGIVVYGSRGEVRLPLTDIGQRGRIAAAIDALQTGGSTNAAEGLQLAYEMARESYEPGLINRLVLCSDGVANNGFSTEAGGILDVVRRASDEGITLSTVGFGMGNFNDVLMEKLADQGDGNYHYVDKLDEAERVFRENLTGLLQTIAREVKVQVEFDPARVKRWRLLGYENRDVADKDFRNDAVDAGEVGAGHQVTALYELKLAQPADPGRDADDRARRPAPQSEVQVGTVRLRWEAPAHDRAHAGEVTEIAEPIRLAGFAGDYAAGTPWLRVQTVVAEFAEILRGSYWARDDSLAALVPLADALAAELPGDAQVRDLARLIRQAADIAGAAEK